MDVRAQSVTLRRCDGEHWPLRCLWQPNLSAWMQVVRAHAASAACHGRGHPSRSSEPRTSPGCVTPEADGHDRLL